MTFEEIEAALPNGFHDSAISRLTVNFAGSLIEIALRLLVGTPDDPDSDRYRAGTLKLNSPYLFFVEAPDPTYPFLSNGLPVNASGAPVKLGDDPKIDALLQRIPTGATAFVFFLDDWNSYLYLAGSDLNFSWDDGRPGGASPAA